MGACAARWEVWSIALILDQVPIGCAVSALDVMGNGWWGWVEKEEDSAVIRECFG